MPNWNKHGKNWEVTPIYVNKNFRFNTSWDMEKSKPFHKEQRKWLGLFFGSLNCHISVEDHKAQVYFK